MRKIILDTSFLLASLEKPGPVSFRDLEEIRPGFSLVMPAECYEELVAKVGSAKASDLISKLSIEVIEVGAQTSPDDAVVALARRTPGAAVATLDVELKNRLRSEGIPVIYLRSGKRLETEGLFPYGR